MTKVMTVFVFSCQGCPGYKSFTDEISLKTKRPKQNQNDTKSFNTFFTLQLQKKSFSRRNVTTETAL